VVPLLLAGAVAFVALAAARPTLARSNPERVRTDAEAYVVIDTSVSMLARARRHDVTRIDVARGVARALADALPPDLRLGLAVMPQGVLPVLGPTTDRGLARAVIEQVARVGRLPAKPQDLLMPASSTAPSPAQAQASYVATNLTALKTLVAAPFYRRATTKRLAVLVTDAESASFPVRTVSRALARAKVQLLTVRVGSVHDRLWRPIDGRIVLDRGYVPATAAHDRVARLARSFGGPLYESSDETRVVSRIRRLLGSGHDVITRRMERQIALGPYLALFALVLVSVPLAAVVPSLPVGRRRALRGLEAPVGRDQPDLGPS
jgi:hypothetical protein